MIRDMFERVHFMEEEIENITLEIELIKKIRGVEEYRSSFRADLSNYSEQMREKMIREFNMVAMGYKEPLMADEEGFVRTIVPEV